jgi:hypothetical protein
MELFAATGKLKKFFLTTRYVGRTVYFPPLPRDLADLKAWIIVAVKNIDSPMLTCVWQELEYRIDVRHVTRGVHIEHLLLSKKNLFSFPVAVNNSIKVGPFVFLL